MTPSPLVKIQGDLTSLDEDKKKQLIAEVLEVFKNPAFYTSTFGGEIIAILKMVPGMQSILVRIIELPSANTTDRNMLAKEVALVLKMYFPDQGVDVYAKPHNPMDGYHRID